ncbi:porin family protein [Salinibacter grassmerensis]|uniref:porin family protein n=1 Tax=Salinibacter grassmerensis TaxID=3040353 RepID=UPI0021E768EE|nr:porin family protein [Salinibacter grassmerensis]
MQTVTSKLTASIATLALLLGLALPMTSQAQSPVDIGVRGGVTQATFYGDDVSSNDFRPGFTGGVFVNYQVNEAFAVQPEVLYSRRGAKNHFNKAGSEDIRVSQDVIEIPVLLKLSAPTAPVTPRIYAGPALGFITNSEVDGADADDSFTDVDFSGVVGGEIAYALNKGPLSEIAVDGRYNLGLANLGDADNFEDVSTSAFTGTLSLRFNL